MEKKENELLLKQYFLLITDFLKTEKYSGL